MNLSIQERTTVRFEADRLPASKRPMVVLRGLNGEEGLDDSLDADTMLLTLHEDATLREAREMAERLNRRVERIGAAEVTG